MSAAVALTAAFDTAISELESLVDRVLQPPPDLWLDYDPFSFRNTPWIVKDGAQQDAHLARFTERGRAVAFMETMCSRIPGGRIDYDSVRGLA